MSIVTTSITNAQWNDLKIEFKGKDTKVYFKDKEIKKIINMDIVKTIIIFISINNER